MRKVADYLVSGRHLLTPMVVFTTYFLNIRSCYQRLQLNNKLQNNRYMTVGVHVLLSHYPFFITEQRKDEDYDEDVEENLLDEVR